MTFRIRETSCTDANNSHVDTIKYLTNKYLFMCLKLSSTSRCTIFDIMNLSLSTRCRCPSIIATATLSNEGDRENAMGEIQVMVDTSQHF
jgi:hypothetical protein